MTTAFTQLFLPTERCLWTTRLSGLPEEVPDGCFLAAEVTDRQAESALFRLHQRLGSRLLVPEVWQQVLPEAGILISSQLSGGTVAQRLEEAQAALPGRCWLRLSPFAERLTLPCPTGCGTPVSQAELEELLRHRTVFRSSALGCSYCYDRTGSVVLFRKDFPEELSVLAEQSGFLGTVVSGF